MTDLSKVRQMAQNIANNAQLLGSGTDEDTIECGIMSIHKDATKLVRTLDGLLLAEVLAPTDSRQDRTP